MRGEAIGLFVVDKSWLMDVAGKRKSMRSEKSLTFSDIGAVGATDRFGGKGRIGLSCRQGGADRKRSICTALDF